MKKCIAIICGAFILAFGMFNIFSRCDISEGGVLGLSLLIYHWWDLSPGITCFIMDVTAFLIGAAVLRKGFIWYSIFASGSYALFYTVFEFIGPVLPDLTAIPWAASIAGGLFVGVGAGLIVRYDCAAGGDDALALVFHKLTGLKVSGFYVISDFCVLLLSLTYIPFNRIIWSLISMVTSCVVIELLRPRENEKNT